MLQKLVASLAGLSLVAVAAAPQAPAEPIDVAANATIRAEGLERSKIMWIEHYLTDVYGPRPIGSPNHKAAAEWALNTMTSWGMVNAHLEPFTWRGVGWLPGRATGYITSPVKATLKFEAVPWSPSTNGTISGEVVVIAPPATPTDVELKDYLVTIAARVKGHIVLAGAPPTVPVNFHEPEKRIPDEQARARYAPTDENASRSERGGRGTPAPAPEGHLSAFQVNQRIAQFLRDNPPALRLVAQGGGRIPGVIVAQNGAGQIYDDLTPQTPAVILRNEDYGRIARISADGTPVSVEFNVQNQYFPGGRTSYVAVAEIPGTDKADEVVMLGGHLDSWTSATGATDNAIGCAIMMEAARILEATRVKPRRTIRVALWSGEEEGLLGSFDYVKRHFGSAESPQADYEKLDAYWNIDDGTGLVRGATVFGPPAAAAVVAQYLKPFEDWGVYGANPSSARIEGGSDNGAFAVAGLPGIGAQQDPIEYFSTTWHSNLDTYERIVPDDVMKNAVISASLVLGLANRDARLPRFPAGEMPAIPPSRTGFGRGNAAPLPESRIFQVATGKTLSVPAPGLLPAPTRTLEPPPARAIGLDTSATHGKAIVTPDGGLTYTPDKGFTGTDTFTFHVTTGTTTVSGTATILVR